MLIQKISALGSDIRTKTLDGYLYPTNEKRKRICVTIILIFFIGLINYYSYITTVDYISIDDSKKMFNVAEPDLETIRMKHKFQPMCLQNPDKDIRTPVSISYTNRSLKWVNMRYSQVHEGGFYTPKRCQARHKIVILLPYRDREKNLKTLLVNLHPYLMKQQLEYRIFVIEQVDSSPFNMGKLYNAGFLESKRFGDYHCLIFHEVDLLPLNNGVMYTCPIMPRHMSATIYKQMSEKSVGFLQRQSPSIFGGVTALTPKQFQRVNGFSNFYWGLDGVDNDFYWRLRSKGYQIVRYNKTIAEYVELAHSPVLSAKPTKLREILQQTARKRLLEDGLSSLQYKVMNITRSHLFTNIKVNINPSNEKLENVETYLRTHFF